MSPDWNHIDRRPDTEAKERVVEVFRRISRICPDRDAENVGDIPALRFDSAAQVLFNEWYGDLERRLRSGAEHPAFEAHLAKYRSLVPSLALLCHLVDVGEGNVGEHALLRACSWAEYLESHARRIYSLGGNGNQDVASTLLRHIQAGDLDNPFTARDIKRKKWSGLRSPEAVDKALAALSKHRYIRSQRVGTGGAPRIDYHINPALGIPQGPANTEEAA